MKQLVAVLGVILLALILYVESTSLTNRYYWISRHPEETFSSIFSRDYSSNGVLITAWNSFVAFVPNILHTINGIRLDIKRNLSPLKQELLKLNGICIGAV